MEQGILFTLIAIAISLVVHIVKISTFMGKVDTNLNNAMEEIKLLRVNKHLMEGISQKVNGFATFIDHIEEDVKELEERVRKLEIEHGYKTSHKG